MSEWCRFCHVQPVSQVHGAAVHARYSVSSFPPSSLRSERYCDVSHAIASPQNDRAFSPFPSRSQTEMPGPLRVPVSPESCEYSAASPPSG